MPSEKQIEEGMRGWIDAITNAPENEGVHERRRRLVVAILTAAEQAEPAILPDDSLSAIISNIGNEIHNLACERQNDEDLSERLSDFRTRLWAIAQQAEPAPVARTGAVKVKAVLELVQYHVTDDDDRATLTMAISALEPAEPTGFIATLSDDQKKAALNYTGPDSVSAEPAAWRDGKGRTLDRLMSMWRRRDEALDRGEWLGVSEIAGRLVRPKNEVRDELRRLAIDGKIEREDFSNGTFWRGVLPSDITRPPESRLREALERIARGLSLTFTSNPTKMSGTEAQEIARAALAQGADDE